MTLQLIANAADIAANSYATVDQADSLATFRVGGSVWDSLDADQRVQALVTATRDIDTLAPYFRDTKNDDAQPLEFPRAGALIFPRVLVQATIELALSYAPSFASDGTSSDPLNVLTAAEQGIKSEQVGPIKTEYVGPVVAPGGVVYFNPMLTNGGMLPVGRFPGIVQRLLVSLLEPIAEAAAPNAWGTGSAQRSS